MAGALYEHGAGEECSFQRGARIDRFESFVVIEYQNVFPSAER